LIPALAFVVSPEVSLGSFLLLGTLAALLSLDDVALGQTWFGQPLTVGLLAGFFCGDPVTGLALGLPLQLVLAANLPIGQGFTGEPTSAIVAAVGGSILTGNSFKMLFAEGINENLGMLGWVILGIALMSGLGHFAIQAERQTHVLWMLGGHRTLRDGNLGRMEQIHGRCLVVTFLRGLILGLLWLLFVIRLWIPLFEVLPGQMKLALSMLPLLAPGLGAGAILEHYGLRSSWPWVLAGATFTFVIGFLTR